MWPWNTGGSGTPENILRGRGTLVTKIIGGLSTTDMNIARGSGTAENNIKRSGTFVTNMVRSSGTPENTIRGSGIPDNLGYDINYI